MVVTTQSPDTLCLYSEERGHTIKQGEDIVSSKSAEISDGAGHVRIIGAGLCGTLLSIILARRGYKVEVYERRNEEALFDDSGRSFNITLTERGLAVLRRVGIEQEVLSAGRKCFGRRVHTADRGQFSTPYGDGDVHGIDFLLSISRVALNTILLRKAQEEGDNLKLFFDWNLSLVDLKRGILKFVKGREEQTASEKQTVVLEADAIVIGTDGCFSKIRQAMMHSQGFDFSQSWSEYRYKELSIPKVDNQFALSNSNSLHLWPRDDCMLLAFPNNDKSFTASFFAKQEVFQNLQNEATVKQFFQERFSDALASMPALVHSFMNNPTGVLLQTACSRYHHGSQFVLLGDSAHSMVPFMGQGTNCAFEDCQVFVDLLATVPFSEAIQKFSDVRKPAADAICKTAEKQADILAKMHWSIAWWVRQQLAHYFPQTCPALYQSLCFTSVPYNECIEYEAQLESRIQAVLLILVGLAIAISTLFISQICVFASYTPFALLSEYCHAAPAANMTNNYTLCSA